MSKHSFPSHKPYDKIKTTSLYQNVVQMEFLVMTMHISLIPSSKITKQTCTEMLLLQPPAKFCMFVWGIFFGHTWASKRLFWKVKCFINSWAISVQAGGGGQENQTFRTKCCEKNCLVSKWTYGDLWHWKQQPVYFFGIFTSLWFNVPQSALALFFFPNLPRRVEQTCFLRDMWSQPLWVFFPLSFCVTSAIYRLPHTWAQTHTISYSH